MHRFRLELTEFHILRRNLRRDMGDAVDAAEKSGWAERAVDRVRVDVRRLIELASRFSLLLLVPAVVFLVVVIAYLVAHDPRQAYGIGYWAIGLAEFFLGICAMWLFWPLVGVLRTVRRLPDGIYRELVQPLWINLDLLNITINCSLLLYAFLAIRTGGATPLLIILSLIWLFAPLSLFYGRHDRWFVIVRVGQLAVLFCTVLFFTISPVPIGQYQWWAEHQMAKKLRVVHLHEITSHWKNLKWFSPEGMPLVWYSYRAGSGYHLYSSPGHDPETNAKLREVSNEQAKERILADLKARQEAVVREEARKQAQRKAQAKQEEELAAKETAAREARAKAEAQQRMVRKYVNGRYTGGSAREDTALIALNDQGTAAEMLAQRLSKALDAAGYDNISGVFTPKFMSSDDFESFLSGNPVRDSFRVADFAAKLLIVQVSTTSEHERVAGNDLIQAKTILRVRLFDAATASAEFDEEVKGQGVAFRESDARADALEKAEAGIPSLAAKLKGVE